MTTATEERPEPTTPPKPTSLVDVILLSMLKIERAGGPGWVNRLVKVAWRNAPRRFGLGADWQSYPDSHRVRMELPKMIRRGLLARPRPNVYALTTAGRVRAVELERREAGA